MSDRSAAQAWLRALELTARIPKHPHRILSTVIEELAEQFGSAPALLSDRECLTYRALAERSNRYARWAIEQGLAKGDAVCLLMPNRPEYMASRSEEHTSELQSPCNLVCRLLLE